MRTRVFHSVLGLGNGLEQGALAGRKPLQPTGGYTSVLIHDSGPMRFHGFDTGRELVAPEAGADCIHVVGVPLRELKDSGDGVVGHWLASACLARVLDEVPVVRLRNAVKGDLAAQAAKRPLLILEHPCQQVPLAPGEQVGNIP